MGGSLEHRWLRRPCRNRRNGSVSIRFRRFSLVSALDGVNRSAARRAPSRREVEDHVRRDREAASSCIQPIASGAGRPGSGRPCGRTRCTQYAEGLPKPARPRARTYGGFYREQSALTCPIPPASLASGSPRAARAHRDSRNPGTRCEQRAERRAAFGPPRSR